MNSLSMPSSLWIRLSARATCVASARGARFSYLSAGVDRETVVRAVIQSPNLTPSHVPALRIAFQTHDGVPLGHWLVFPSDDVVPAMSEIRGRLAWPTEGVPRGVALVRSMQDFDGVGGGEWRFPGPGGETHNID